MRVLALAGLLSILLGVGTSHATPLRRAPVQKLRWRTAKKVWKRAFRPLKLTKQDYANYGPDAGRGYVRFVERVIKIAAAVRATPILGPTAKKINKGCEALNCLLPDQPQGDLGFRRSTMRRAIRQGYRGPRF